MMKTWLMRRSVRSPPAFAVTLRIISSVCRLPFIRTSPLPSWISSTALGGGGLAVRSVDDLVARMFRSCLAATSLIFAAGPDQDRLDDAGFGGLDRAAQRTLVAGMHDDGRNRRDALRRRDQAVVFRRAIVALASAGIDAHCVASDLS